MLVADEGMIGGHQVKILDFGIAKIFNESDGDGTQTSAGDQQPGTPAYMPPEQFKPLNKEGDPGKMDVYALGVIAYQMLAGRLPLWNPDRFVLTMMVMTVDPEPLGKLDPSLPPTLTALVAQMLAKEPAARPTMDQVRAQLAGYLGLKQSRTDVVTIRPTTEINAIMPLPATGDVAAVSTEDTPPVGQSSAAATPSVGAAKVRPMRLPPEPGDGHLSSGAARGTTGQQVTGAEARAGRQAGRMLLLGGAGAVAMVGLLLAVLSSSSRNAPPPPAVPAAPAAGATSTPALVVTPLGPAAAPTVAPAVASDAPAPRGRSRSACAAVTPTESCIAGQLSAADRRAFLSALDEADVRLCASDHLTVIGKPSLMVKSAGGVRRSKQEHFVLALRGNLKSIAFPGEVEIRCRAK